MTISKFICLFSLIALFISGCAPSQEEIASQTAIAATAIAASWTATPSPTSTPTVTPSPTSTPTTTFTPTPSITPTPTLEHLLYNPSDIIFEDDFSNNSSRWNVASDLDGITDFIDDAYRIRVTTPNFYLWSNPDYLTDMGDIRIEVDATKMSGPEANDMGIICRYVDEQNFYFFTISSDGYFGISKLNDGEESLISADEMGYKPSAIKPGSNNNHITVECVGSSLSLYVNNVMLARVSDSDFVTGNVGLIAGTYDEGGVEIRFDNFVVLKP